MPGRGASGVPTIIHKGEALAKPNFQYQKRQRELEKKRKQEEKRLRKQERAHPAAPGDAQGQAASNEVPQA